MIGAPLHFSGCTCSRVWAFFVERAVCVAPSMWNVECGACTSALGVVRSSVRTLDWRPVVRMDSKDRDESLKEVLEENIIIVGGGIGGLACALALHRVGLKSLVLEQAEALRARGGAIILWDNAFRVLDVLGVGDQLRDMFTCLAEWEVLNARGKSLANVVIAECEGGLHDLRIVERKCLLEALARALPKGTIRFNSCVTGLKTLETNSTSVTQIQLQDGTTYSAKVVIGYDGINSTIGSWMGLAKPQMVGYCSILGTAVFPDGHQFAPKVQFFMGKGMRFGYLPMNATKVSWFLSWNTWIEGWQITTPEQLKCEAFQVSKPFSPPVIHHIITNTPSNHLWKRVVRQRLNKHHLDQTLVVNNITVAGDACHPMTPHLGQGAAMALEDAIVLTRHLHGALRVVEQKEKTSLEERVKEALEGYQAERWMRTCELAEEAHRIGWVTQSMWAVVVWIRDWVVVPWGMRKEAFGKHALFDVGGLPREV